MKLWHFTTAIDTDPPSTAVIAMCETETDRMVVAELCDQINANRAPNEAIRQNARHGRIMVTAFAAELGIKKGKEETHDQVYDKLLDPTRDMLQKVGQEMKVDPKELLQFGFMIRFFQW